MEKRDFIGNELSVGDDVIFMEIDYRNFLIGRIVKLNPKKATIEYEIGTNSKKYTTYQFYEQLIKFTGDFHE